MTSTEMNEEKATAILVENGILLEGDLSGQLGPSYGHYVAWKPGDEDICLDSDFTLEELQAIVWWMENKGAVATGQMEQI